MRGINRLGWLSLFAVLALRQLHAAELRWIGGTDTSWHTPANWAPIIVPGEDPIQRIPQDGDTVLIADIADGSIVRLSEDSALLAGLEIANGMELDSGGHFLHVDNGGSAMTIIRGAGSRLSLTPNNLELRAFQTDLLEVLDGGGFNMLDDRSFNGVGDGTAHILYGAVIDASSQFEGRGTAIFGDEATPLDVVLLRNEGTIRPIRSHTVNQFGRLRLVTRGGALIDYDGESGNGVIDADEPGRVAVDGWAARSVPFSGALFIGADDVVESILYLYDAEIQFKGADAGAAQLTYMREVSGSSRIDVVSGVGVLVADSHPPQLPNFRMVGGSIHVHENATLALGSSDDGGLFEFENTSVFLDRGARINSTSVAVTFDLGEAELDGIDGSATIKLSQSSLTLVVQALEMNASPRRFDGTIDMYGSRLTTNAEDGWELDGRIFMDNVRNNSIYGTTIVVDGGEPQDGIYSYGEYADIFADLVLTENALIHVEASTLRIHGNVTNYRSELGSGDGQVVFLGDRTTFSMPTRLGVGVTMGRGTIVLEEELTLTPGGHIQFDRGVQFSGEASFVNQGETYLENGQNLNISLVNEGWTHVASSREAEVKLKSFRQAESGTLAIVFANSAIESHLPTRLQTEGEVALDGRLLVTIGERSRFNMSIGRRYEIISAEAGVEGRFATYVVEAVHGGFWKVDYSPTSVALEVVRLLQGDYNDSLTVEQGDLDLVLLNWGTDATSPPDNWFNNFPSALIDQEELDRVLLNWGDVILIPSRPIVGVPEPATLAILLVCLLASAYRQQTAGPRYSLVIIRQQCYSECGYERQR